MGRLFIRYRYAWLTIAILIAATTGFFLYPNFHTVIPDQVYRSAQLNQTQFVDYIDKYHIKSVVNLRGVNSDDDWYTDELQAMQLTHTEHYDLGLSANSLASAAQMQRLTQILLTAPRPILIHCWRGSDRTGLAAGMALILFGDSSLGDAKEQASWRFGAVNSDSIGKQELYYYEQWLAKNHLNSSRENFLRWIAQLHNGPDYPYHD